MKKFQYILGAAIILSAASCSIENINETPVSGIQTIKMEFSAETPAPNPKTSIDPSADNAVYWTKDDAISVFPIGGGNYKFVLKGDGGSSSGTFAGEATEADTYYALYPYNASASLSGTTITSTLPSTQYSTADGTFDTMLSPVAGISSDGSNNFELQHIAGLLELNFTNLDGTVKEIQLKAAESMAGDYTVSLADGTFSASAVQSDEAVGVHLVAKDGGPLAEGPYYLVLLPGTYTDVQLFITLNDGASYMVGTLDTFEVKAGELRPQTVDASKATANNDGLYGLYQAGADIVIAGKIYNKSKYGDATLISSDTEITNLTNNSGTYFINPNATLTYNAKNQAIYKLLLIGNDNEQRSKIKFNYRPLLNQSSNTDGTFVVYNAELDLNNVKTGGSGESAENPTGYFITLNNDMSYGYTGIIDTHINMGSCTSLTTSTSSKRTYSEFAIQDSEIYFSKPNSGTVYLFNFCNANNYGEYGTISVKNSILYSDNAITDFRILHGFVNSGASITGEISVNNFIFENNTVYNLWVNTNSFVRYGSLNSINVSKNIIWNSSVADTNSAFFRPSGSVTSPASVEDGTSFYKGNPKGEVLFDNIVYIGSTYTKSFNWFYGGNTRVDKTGYTAIDDTVEATPIASDPFTAKNISPTSCELTQSPEYASYGAQR